MESGIKVGTPEDGYRQFCSVGPRTIEMALDHTYGDLSHVPGQGRAYMLRFMAATRPGDIYRVDPRLRRVTEDLFTHLAEAGIACMRPEDVIWDEQFGAGISLECVTYTPEVFFFNEEVSRLRPDGRRLVATNAYENKCDLFTRYTHQNANVPRTCVVRNREILPFRPIPTPEEAWEAIGQVPGRLKANRCASGGDNEEFTNLEELTALMGAREWRERDYVVQQDVGDLDASANYFADETGVYFLFTTLQNNVNGKIYDGNVHDYHYRAICRQVADPMAYDAWMAGIRGFFGFDVRALIDASQAWVIECNARPTAPVYGWLAAQVTESREWLVSNLKEVHHQTIDTLVPTSLRFTRIRGFGAIVHSPGPLASERACSVTVLGPTTEVCANVLRELKRHARSLRHAA